VTPAATVVLAAVLGLLLSGVFLQLARHRGWGKTVRDDGPQRHRTKSGTPTMGGAAFLVVALILALLVGPRDTHLYVLVALVAASGALGLADDLLSLRRARAERLRYRDDASDAERIAASTGLLARYRLFGQGVLALLFAGYAVYAGAVVSGSIPVDVLFLAFVVVGSINAFNFTDGLDGLAAGLTAIVLLLFLGSPLAAALIGALLGFLWYNAHPARVFMGGVGSEGLGAAVAGLAILSGGVWWLLVFALLPVLAVLSVIVQVIYFRATGGRRLLRMAPLHHHLELSGWPETRIVARYWLLTAVLVAFTWHATGGGLW
jgi:phospho-N-acetylmuramoyl-pentapeptide-transferase